jgi:azurin
MLIKNKLLVTLFMMVLLTACGGNGEKVEEPKTVKFNLTGNDQMLFNLKSMVVKEGDEVVVNFENIGKMPKETMGHNFVLLKQNVDVADFAAKAVQAKDNEYIPEDETDKIIVHSKLLGPGEKTVVKFTAPAKGTYKFICSFPGHYMTMQGNLIVR